MDAPRETIARARELRRRLTAPEAYLWQALLQRPAGLKFRHQHPFSRLVLDFYCPAGRLCIEVDSSWHNEHDAPARDLRRDTWLLLSQGVLTHRVAASHVMRRRSDAIDEICRLALERRQQFIHGGR